jgi:hypothetical protein
MAFADEQSRDTLKPPPNWGYRKSKVPLIGQSGPNHLARERGEATILELRHR